MPQEPKSEAELLHAEFRPIKILLVLLIITIAGFGVVVYLAMHPGGKESESNAQFAEFFGANDRNAVPPPSPRDPSGEVPREDAQPSSLLGNTYRGTVAEVGRKGDGIVRVHGKVVFVKGAVRGEHVEFKVTEDLDRYALAEVVSKSPAPFPDELKPETNDPAATPAAHPVEEGQVLEVTVVEKDHHNPDQDGVARIEKFVVFVPGAQPGDRARIRITEVRERSASSEVLERLPPGAP